MPAKIAAGILPIPEREPALLLADDPSGEIARFDLLRRLEPEQRVRLRKAGRLVRHAHGQNVFHQGLRHAGIYVIESGRVRTYFTGPSGRDITLAYWTPGHFVGGPELFGEGVHIWSGMAVGDTQTLFLDGPSLRQLMNDLPGLAVCLVEGLVHKGRCYSELLQVLATQSVEERLWQLLQNLGCLYGRRENGFLVVDRHFSHEELASMVGATRQWVTMTLRRLQKQGLVAVHGRRLAVLDRGITSADPKPARLAIS
jgi:CRP/FNR family transcriptional regulator, cyclic AMP receptor protein